MRTIVGRATVVPGSNNARLKVRFFGPFAGDYWIIGLDEKNYSWALVGHPSRRFLWILSREPTMKESLYKEDRRHRRAQGLHGQSHKAYAVFDQLLKTSPVIAAKTIAIFALA